MGWHSLAELARQYEASAAALTPRIDEARAAARAEGASYRDKLRYWQLVGMRREARALAEHLRGYYGDAT